MPGDEARLEWIEFPGGVSRIGHDGEGFAFDNEGPRHRVYLEPFRIASRPVTVGEYLAFMEDGGYARPELWLSDGWAVVQSQGWEAPLYWERDGGEWWSVHAGRAPAPRRGRAGLPRQLLRSRRLRPLGGGAAADRGRVGGRGGTGRRSRGTCLECGPSPPAAAPRRHGNWPVFRRRLGVDAEPVYALSGLAARGRVRWASTTRSSCATSSSCAAARARRPASHIRATYRNFFPPEARWQFSGIRLARDSMTITHRRPARPPRAGRRARPVPPRRPHRTEKISEGRSMQILLRRGRVAPLRRDLRARRVLPHADRDWPSSDAPRRRDGRRRSARTVELIELGSGSGLKTRLLLEQLAIAAGLPPGRHLGRAPLALGAIAGAAVPRAPRRCRSTPTSPLPFALPDTGGPRARRVVYFPGSTIGNFGPGEALTSLALDRAARRAGRGASDRVRPRQGRIDRRRPPTTIARGVTAAFNLNLLVRINRELGGDFDLKAFAHRADLPPRPRAGRDAPRQPTAAGRACRGRVVPLRRGGDDPHGVRRTSTRPGISRGWRRGRGSR